MKKRYLTLAALFFAAAALLTFDRSGELPPDSVRTELFHTVTPLATPAPPPRSTEVSEPEETPFSQYAPTVNMRFSELVGDNGDYETPKGYPAADTYRVIVDIAHQVVLVYGKDDTGAYTVPIRYMLCSTGLNNRTPRGTFSLKRYRVRFGLFRNDKTYGQYWTLINGRIYFHSMLYAERDANTYIGETYDLLGTPASHGCIRLTVPDARFIYYNLSLFFSIFY